ncbi:MAG: metallophosphoesterase [Formosimonas sp.]
MMSIFPIIVTSIMLIFSVYIGKRLIPPSWRVSARALAWVLLLLLALTVPLGFIVRGSNTPWLPWFNYGFGLYSLLITFTILHDVFHFSLSGSQFTVTTFRKLFNRLSKRVPQKAEHKTRREFLRGASRVGVLGASAAVFGYGASRAAAMPTLHRIDVAIKDLPTALDGLTIAQLSDVHIGQLAGEPEYVARIVAAVNSADVDILALTGDFVDGSVERLRENFAPLGLMKAKYGAFFATGNHEYYSGAEKWMAYFRSLNWDVLENEHRVLDINGAQLVLAGVLDYKGSRNCNPSEALHNAPVDVPRILLAHNPETAFLTDGLNIDLQLSGHTHAGQYFPATWLVHWVHKYAQGLNWRNAMQIYVNSGTGYWGPAIRTTDITGEITLITLKTARV